MADRQTDLAIIIEAQNKASKQLKQIEKDLGGMNNAIKEQGEASKTASLSFGELVAGVALGSVVADIAMKAMRSLLSVLTQIPTALYDIGKYASEVSGVGIAMHMVANNAGITADAVDKVRDSVVEQNVTTAAANRLLTDLIRNQVDYTQATELATAAQNIAVASGVSSSETIERISQSISSGNTWLLRQLGLVEHLDTVYEKYGETLNKTSEEMTSAERKQAVVNYVLSEGEKYTGAYEAAMTNASKVMRSTSDRIKEMSYSFGQVLEPALYEVSKVIYDTVNSIVKWAHEHEAKLKGVAKVVGDFMRGVVNSIKSFIANIPWSTLLDVLNYVIRQVMQFRAGLKIVSNTIQIFVRGLLNGINTLKAFGKAVESVLKGDFSNLKNVYADWKDYSSSTGEAIMGDLEDIDNALSSSMKYREFTLQEWWKSVEEIEGSGWEDMLKAAEEGGEELSMKQKDTLKKMLRDIEKENADYQRAVEKRTKDFEQSFEDLIISHRDAIKGLTDDLDDENKEYKKKVSNLVSNYNEAMSDIETRHKEKTDSVIEDMEDERKKTLEEIEKVTEKYNEERMLIKREGEDRLSTLKAQLDQELALGDNASRAKIEALEKMIAYEQEGLDTSLDDKKTKHDEEVADINEALDEKLDKLQKSLEAENLAYEEAFAERKDQYEEDILDAKEAHEEKRQALQEELDKEIVIRNKYADDFKRIGDKIAEDDITRLMRTFNDTKNEMSRAHDERLADIKYQAFKGGEEFGASFASGFDSSYPQVKSSLDRLQSDINDTIGKANELQSKTGGDFDYLKSYPFSPFRDNMFDFGATGGVFTKPTIVGEAGAEVVLPLSFPKRMAQIMQSMGMSGGGGGEVSQNFYITVNSPQDIDLMMERAGFAMRSQGGLK